MSFMFLADPSMNEIRTIHCNIWWPFAVICFMVGIIGIMAIVVLNHMQHQPDYEVGITTMLVVRHIL